MEEKENAEKKTNVVAAVGVGFVCLVIGLPLWWKTTDVYRVSLPYSDINTLVQTKIEYTVDLDVVSYVEAFSAADLAALARNLNRLFESKPEDEVRSHYRLSTREASKEERLALKSSSSFSDLDRALADQSLGRPNQYKVYLLPTTASVNIRKPTLGIHRNVFIKATAPDQSSELAEIIVSTIRQSVVREPAVQKGYHTARGTRNMKPDKEMLRSVRFHPGYDVILTLVNPRPDLLDIHWDVEAAVKAYLMPFVELMQNYTDINIKSQVLYFTKLQTKPQREKNEYFFTSRDLPLMINPLEAKLGSPASTNPELNFLVYVPSPDQYPLYIINENGQKLASNSFMSPQWGGITIYNISPPPENAPLPVSRSVNTGKVMEVFLSQLRLLLNLHALDKGDVDSALPGSTATTEWEVDSWLRSRCVENLATSSATLHSLAQLLGKISNIVINDDIGNEVHQAVAAMQESVRLLSEGNLVEAYQQSKNAIQASETAFFDPSLLELLYFPEDQKFAIYIPLFLPISFPVLASLWQSFKWYKGLSKPKQE